jgi:hypothetical protein
MARAASQFADNPDVARRNAMRFLLPALVAIAVLPVGAHHPFAPYYDGSKLASISGPIVELRTINPHVVLIIDGTGPDGRTGRWAFEGLPPTVFLYRGLKDYKERLKPGTTITISGWPAKDPQARAFSGREVTFADGTTMLFGISAPGAGEERWKCDSPCPYTYPEVQ